MELLSGVQERLGPLRAWLFPPRVFLQLEDQAITAMALEGRRITWLERVALPSGLCQNGEPLRVDALGDLIGDLLVERGAVGARLDAVLPAAASECRLIQWPAGCWPKDPQQTLDQNAAELGLARALQYLDLHLVPLDREPPTSLLVSVPSVLLDRWIEVFTLAGAALDRLESASLCLARSAEPLWQAATAPDVCVVLQVEASQTLLLALEQGVPMYQRRLPGLDQAAVLQQDLQRWLLFWQQLRVASPEPPLLLLHGPALADATAAGDLVAALGCPWQTLDPLALQWLETSTLSPDDAPAEGASVSGPSLATLWGLAVAQVLP